jgi:hypothetical protein
VQFDLTADEIHDFIVKDFIGAWDSITMNPDPAIGRGNFMFGRQAMNLLEFVSMLCSKDSSHTSLSDYSEELFKIDSKYFTKVPGKCTSTRKLTLPYVGIKNGDHLLWALFDLIRNGLAHQYQQIMVELKDGKAFIVTLTGADHGRSLTTIQKLPRPVDHLAYLIDPLAWNISSVLWTCPRSLKPFNSTSKKPNLPRIGIGTSNLFAWLNKKPYFGLS